MSDKFLFMYNEWVCKDCNLVEKTLMPVSFCHCRRCGKLMTPKEENRGGGITGSN
jgi:hypothetical protein